MTLNDLLQSVSITDVWNMLKRYDFTNNFYCDKKVLYNMYNELLNLEAKKSTLDKIIIRESQNKDYKDIKNYYKDNKIEDIIVLGIIDNNEYDIAETDWKEWLDVEIECELYLSNEELLFHIMWEMSWNGWTYENWTKNVLEFKKIIADNTKYINQIIDEL